MRIAPRPLELAQVDGLFAICKFDKATPLPEFLTQSEFFSVTRTPDELSIVCRQGGIPDTVRCERNWRCLRVSGTIPFDAAGILASLIVPLAEAGISIFAISTFDTDYLLVKDHDWARTLTELQRAGHTVRRIASHR